MAVMQNKLEARRRMVWTAVCVVYILFIFSNSLQAAEESSERSMAILTWVQEEVFQGADSFITEHIIRKLAHFSEFLVAGILGMQCISGYRTRRADTAPIALFAVLLVALTDETIQLFVEGRSGQVSDVWIDFAGAVVGVLLTRCVAYVMDNTPARAGRKEISDRRFR